MKSMREEEERSIEGAGFAQGLVVLEEKSRAQSTRLHGRIKVHVVLIQGPLWPREKAHEIRPKLDWGARDS